MTGTADRVAAYLGARAEAGAASAVRMQQATIQGVGLGTVDLLFQGDVEAVVPGVRFLDSYLLPQVGDTAWVLAGEADRLVIGKVGPDTRSSPVFVPAPGNGPAASGTTVTMMSVQFVAEGGIRYKVTLSWSGIFGTVAGDIMRMSLTDAADPGLAAGAASYSRLAVSANQVHESGSYFRVWTPPVGLRTVNWVYARSLGTGTVSVFGPGSSMTVERFDP